MFADTVPDYYSDLWTCPLVSGTWITTVSNVFIKIDVLRNRKKFVISVVYLTS